MYEALKGAIAKRKQIDHLTYRDLSELTGYKPSTLMAFMCGARETRNVAEALTRALNHIEGGMT